MTSFLQVLGHPRGGRSFRGHRRPVWHPASGSSETAFAGPEAGRRQVGRKWGDRWGHGHGASLQTRPTDCGAAKRAQHDAQQKRGSRLAAPYVCVVVALLVEAAAEPIFHAAGERTPPPLLRRWRDGPGAGPERSTRPDSRGPVMANTTPPNITIKPNNAEDREGSDHRGLERHAGNQHRQTERRTAPRPAAVAARSVREVPHHERSTRTWGPRHRERSRSGRASAAHDRRVAFVPPCRQTVT